MMLPKWLGPGLLFAGAAVGVSHLVQSTRAGAVYGLGLVVVVLIANILKYPGFAFGPRYAAATGTSLLEAYRRQGRLALAAYAVVTLGTMLAVTAAVTLVTTTLIKAVLAPISSWFASLPSIYIALALLVGCTGLVGWGRYRILDGLMKIVVVVLTLSTLAATALVWPRVDWTSFAFFPKGVLRGSALLFIAPLVGWMPSAMDISVWHSLWTLARRRDTGYSPSPAEAMADFNIGYVGTAFLALCFVFLGAGIAYGSGEQIATGMAFGHFILRLYVQTLGDWSTFVIGPCMILVMLSTTLVVVDGFPRALVALYRRSGGAEPQGGDADDRKGLYWAALLLVVVGTIVVLIGFVKQLTHLVDLATTISFVTAPVLAYLNHRAICSKAVARAHRPGRLLYWLSCISILALSLFACGYVYLQFFSRAGNFIRQ